MKRKEKIFTVGGKRGGGLWERLVERLAPKNMIEHGGS
jgi:hypothetical protein